MGWIHRLVSKDINAGTGVCAACGPIELSYRKDRNLFRCPNAVLDQRASKIPGMSASEARAFCAGKVCAICGTDQDLFVDHCHKSLRIRGVLCRSHNIGLGMFGDSTELLSKAIEYIREPPPTL
jgi:hypothetical protein